MRKNLSLRDYQLILVPFVVCLGIGMAVAIVITSRPPGSDADAKQQARAGASGASRKIAAGRNSRALQEDKPDYDVIGKRNLFGYSSTTNQRTAEPETPPPPSPPTPLEIRAAATAPPARQGPAQDRIAVVGMVTIANERLAVIEDIGRGETKFVPVGGTAYGYRLLTVNQTEATLDKNGQQYAVALGENKPEARPAQRGRGAGDAMVVSFGGQGGPGGFGGPGGGGPGGIFNNMTDEQRTQLREQLRNMSPQERQEFFRSQQSNRSGDQGSGQGGTPGGFVGGGFSGQTDGPGYGNGPGNAPQGGRRGSGGGPSGGGFGGPGFGGPGGGGGGGGQGGGGTDGGRGRGRGGLDGSAGGGGPGGPNN